MKTTISFIAVFLFASFSLVAQINSNSPWAWVKGDNTVDQGGVYGTQGVTSSTNKPGARVFSTTWKDSNGNLWLFGGNGYTSTNLGYLNDLWKYDPSTNQWTWMKGDNSISQNATYGSQGNPSSNNKPGATYASVSWIDGNDNLWLFGGFGYTNNSYGFLNSLWKYDPSTNQWTWVKGDKAIDKKSVYGTQGVAGNNNKPGARYGSITWTDSDDNLWLFGGYGYDGAAIGMLNDLWKYDPSTNQWTWINGDNTVEQPSVYGTQGLTDPTNKPGARYVSTCWKDSDDNLWMFGGYGYDENNAGDLNDLWKYDPVTNQWTWISGDKTIDNAGIYGTKGFASATNKPGSRYVSSSWTDINGDLWLFGGFGFDANSSGYLNDLWKYSPSTDLWTWVKGDSLTDQYAIYGTQGMPDPANKSGGRNGSVSWTDTNGNLWLFGGYGYDGSSSGVLNDLWKLTNLMSPLPLRLLNFSGIINNNQVNLQWQTADETDVAYYIIQRSFDGTNFNTIGQLDSKGSALNDYAFTDNDLVNQSAQHFFYRLQMTDFDKKSTYSNILRFDLRSSSATIKLFPNPAVSSIQLSFYQHKPGKTYINFIAANGKVVKTVAANNNSGRSSMITDISDLSSASYIIQIKTPGNTLYTRFIKQ